MAEIGARERRVHRVSDVEIGREGTVAAERRARRDGRVFGGKRSEERVDGLRPESVPSNLVDGHGRTEIPSRVLRRYGHEPEGFRDDGL